MGVTTSGFSGLLATFNRAGALERNLPELLQLEGMVELVVVDDGSSDNTPEVLASISDKRLRVVRHPTNLGQPAARNTAIDHCTQAWALMLEDDCRLPRDYGSVLMRTAKTYPADVVGAPWVHVDEANLIDEVAHRREHGVEVLTLDMPAGTFPLRETESPFFSALILARREVFDKIRYERRYKGNAYREETDLFVRAARAGRRCVMTPKTYSFQVEQFSGGARRGRLATEFWTSWNNWLFLREHGQFLKDRGWARSPVVEQITFMGGRAGSLVRGLLRR